MPCLDVLKLKLLEIFCSRTYVKTSSWLKIAFKVDKMGTYWRVSCFWVIGSKPKLTSLGSINSFWFLTYSLRAFLPAKVWKAIPNDQNIQKKKSLHFHLPHLVLPASYFHQTRLNLISGLFQHPSHYYFRSVWDISQRTSYVLLLYVYDSFEYLYIYWYNSICHINMKNLCLLNVCPIYGWAIYWNSK